MGIDGNQYITVRGPKNILDEMENTKLKLENITGICAEIADAFFGSENIDVRAREKNFLVCHTHFRNKPIKEYIIELLKKYPQCWIKYEYSTEDGYVGIWVGRMDTERWEPVVSEVEWTELSWDEMGNLEDFSLPIKVSMKANPECDEDMNVNKTFPDSKQT